jgi:mannose-6-phosphate isomerase-like protein (cupin superfamily)
MAVELEGGCRVVDLKEGKPLELRKVRIWQHFKSRLSLRVIELDGRATFRNDGQDEVLYDLEQNAGIYVPAGKSIRLEGPATFVSSLTAAEASNRNAAIVHLDDQPVQKTGDRWYRELIQGQVTQFVGSIPPGRAPDHFHLYEEVICILEGEGVMWAGTSSTPVGRGSCIFLPMRQRHCLENTGSGELRLLGVFFPAGSPAVRYDVDDSADGSPEKK